MPVLVPCRDAVADEIPSSPRRIAKAATEAGWVVRTTYARGDLAETEGPDQHFSPGDRVRLGDTLGAVVDVHKDKAHLSVLEDGTDQLKTWDRVDTRPEGAGEGAAAKVVESIVVRMRRAPLAAVGVWWRKEWLAKPAYGFEHALVWSTFTPPRPVEFAELATFVKGVTS